jgi:hypothetical protein
VISEGDCIILRGKFNLLDEKNGLLILAKTIFKETKLF